MNFSSFRDGDDALEFNAQAENEQVENHYSLKSYANDFSSNTTSSLYDAKEGEYIEISKQDISLYFPEGLAGETADEFAFTGENKWMVRDGSKILCRYLDNFAKKNKTTKRQIIPRKYATTLTLDGLTDRPEWSSAHLSVQHFSNELINESNRTPISKSDKKDFMTLIQGEGSLLDDTAHAIETALKDTAKNIIILGPRGTGKSTVLNQVVWHARRNGWLCLFVPRGWDQVMSGPFLGPSATDPTVPDNQFMSAEVLRGFWRAHHPLLKTIPVHSSVFDPFLPTLTHFQTRWKRASSLPGRASFDFIAMRAVLAEDQDDLGTTSSSNTNKNKESSGESGGASGANMGEELRAEDERDRDVLVGMDLQRRESLEDLLRLGVAFKELAGAVLTEIVRQLQQVEHVPVLVAVDQYNSWGPEVDSPFLADTINNSRKKPQPVRACELAVPRALSFISEKKSFNSGDERNVMRNGVFLCATSFKHPEGRQGSFMNHLRSLPLAVCLPDYSQREFLSAAAYYSMRALIYDAVTLNEALAFRTHCGSNPRGLRLQTVPFFLPKASSAMDPKIAYSNAINMHEFFEDESIEEGGFEESEEDEEEEEVKTGGKTRTQKQ